MEDFYEKLCCVPETERQDILRNPLGKGDAFSGGRFGRRADEIMQGGGLSTAFFLVKRQKCDRIKEKEWLP
jgi:hypothetical protein